MPKPHTSIKSNMLARKCVFSVIDFETTGAVAGYPVDPWQVGIVTVDHGRVMAESFFESYMHIGDRPFNPQAPGRHAQIRAELSQAPTPGTLWPEISEWLSSRALVAHNIGTERTVLSKMAPLHRLGPWVDTLTLTRKSYPGFASKALENVIAELHLEPHLHDLCPDRDAHDALYDAFACAILLEHYLALSGWENVTIGALM
ncbi:MAG: 3'-5' exonuclease [Kiritimatiellae bacterium]|jgi:DNA polymerase III epsilon subunit-like protein|nr:3'-5' exonuclease [Kiritimatiellia bacterium]